VFGYEGSTVEFFGRYLEVQPHRYYRSPMPNVRPMFGALIVLLSA
jgi:hypothetical protein